MPQPNLAPTPHRPPVSECLGPNQDAQSVISNRHRVWHDDDVHREAVRADDTGSGRTIEGAGETQHRRGHRPNDRSPSPDGPGPWAFGRRIQRAPFP